MRNRIVHPPKKATKLRWPTAEDLIQAWKLATQHAELIILHTLQFNGKHGSHLRETSRYYTDLDPVPWSTPDHDNP